MPSPIQTWTPTAQEVEEIVVSLRPLIRRFAERDRRLLATWATPAGG
jgi:hypothetical protein